MNALLQTVATNSILAVALALIVFVVTRFVKRPTFAYWLWMLVLLKLVTPPIVTVPLEVWPAAKIESAADVDSPISEAAAPILPAVDFEPLSSSVPDTHEEVRVADEFESQAVLSDIPLTNEPMVAIAPTASESQSVEPVSHSRWSSSAVLGYAWLLSAALWCVIAAVRIARFSRLIRHAEPVSELLRHEAGETARRYGLHSCPDIVAVPGRVPPLLWAARRRPVIAIPKQLLETLSPAEQAMVVAHELAHLRRKDHLFRWFEMAVTALYWWHPVAWWSRRELQQAEEQCCDAWVVWAFPEAAADYAQTLLNTMEFLCVSPAALPTGASGFGRMNQIKRRFEMILQHHVAQRPSWLARIALVCLACLSLSFSVHIVEAQSNAPEASKTEETKAATRAGESVEATSTSDKPSTTADQTVPTAAQPANFGDLKGVTELVKILSDESHQQRAKKTNETLTELKKLGITVVRYEPNAAGELSRSLATPLREGFENSFGRNAFRTPTTVFVPKSLDDAGLENALKLVKSLPQLKAIVFEGSIIEVGKRMTKVAEQLRGITVSAGSGSTLEANPSTLPSSTAGVQVLAPPQSPQSTSTKITDEVMQGLLAALSDEDAGVRKLALVTLASHYNPERGAAANERISEGLLTALSDEDAGIRKTALMRLASHYNPKQGTAVNDRISAGWLAALKDPDPQFRRYAAYRLIYFKPNSPESKQALETIKIDIRNDKDKQREFAAALMKHFGPTSDDAISFMLGMLAEESTPGDENSAREFMRTLITRAATSERVVRELISLAASEKTGNARALEALRAIRPSSDEVIRVFLEALKHNDARIRLCAVGALRRVQPVKQ